MIATLSSSELFRLVINVVINELRCKFCAVFLWFSLFKWVVRAFSPSHFTVKLTLQNEHFAFFSSILTNHFLYFSLVTYDFLNLVSYFLTFFGLYSNSSLMIIINKPKINIDAWLHWYKNLTQMFGFDQTHSTVWLKLIRKIVIVDS
jgi:hypothetical protein